MRVDTWDDLLASVFAQIAHDAAGRITTLAGIGYMVRGGEEAELQQVLESERSRLTMLLNAVRSMPRPDGTAAAHDLGMLVAPAIDVARWLRVASRIELDDAPQPVSVSAASGPFQRGVLLALACASTERRETRLIVTRDATVVLLHVEGVALSETGLREVEFWMRQASGGARGTENGVVLRLDAA